MIVDDKLLDKLMNLSAITINDNNKQNIKKELNEILNFVENLNKIDIKESINIQKFDTPLRDDKPINCNISDNVLKNAPKAEDRFFIVPKIVE